MRQLRPEKGESLAIFQNTDPLVFVLFISLFLTYCIKEGIKGNILDIKFKSVGLIGLYIHLISKDLTSDNFFDPLSRTRYNLIRNVNILQGIPLFQAVAVS